METFRFELVSPEKMAFTGAVESIVVPAFDGDMMIYAGHAPYLATLKAGIVTIAHDGSKQTRILITGGFLDINQKLVSVLAEKTLSQDQWTKESIEHEIEELREQQEEVEDADEKQSLNETINFLKNLQETL